MKRIYLLILMLFVMGTTNSFAQADIELTKNAPDTVRYSNPVQLYYVFQYRFKNKGANALTVSDTIKLKRSYSANVLRLRLPPASGNWPGGLPKDSSVYYLDTVGFTTANTGANNMCDSAWAVNSGGAVITDNDKNNNRTCKSVYFLPASTSVNTLVGEESGLTLYPNPVSNTLNVKYDFQTASASTLAVMDLLGNVVVKQDLGNTNVGERQIPIDVSQLPNGLYILQLSVGDTKLVNKFSIQR